MKDEGGTKIGYQTTVDEEVKLGDGSYQVMNGGRMEVKTHPR